MRVNYKNYPILQKLKDGSLGYMPIHEVDINSFDKAMNEFVRWYWKDGLPAFRNETHYISKPFLEASVKAMEPLLKLYTDISINKLDKMDISGTFLCGSVVCMIDHNINDGASRFFMFSREGVPLCWSVQDDKNEYFWVSKVYELPNHEEEVNFVYMKIAHVITLHMFKSDKGKVDTKLLPPNSKIKDIDCKYMNETDLDIIYLDSKWFTNLIQSDGFTVRGHFRLQPKKINGKWTRDIIWISEFKKKGYTAPAKKLAYFEKQIQS